MHAGPPDQPPDREPTPDPHAEPSPDPAAARPDDASTDHESAYALLQRGHELLRRRHHAQAAIVLERAARIEPGKGSILEALGRAYYNSGQHERSREVFEALLEVDPSAHYAHYALGQSLKQLGRPSQARTHLRLAVALAPGSALYRGALNRLGPPREG
jgi:tetratricopeptide (TPR) repeat protein